MSDTPVTRLAMWSGPRNISTAMMRSFENRSDCKVVDEPFYAFYLDRSGLDHPGRDAIIASQSTDPSEVIDQLLGPVPEGVTLYYQKHMTHHLLPEINLEDLDALTHVFLIRDPQEMVSSYVRSREQVTSQDLGLHQMAELFDRTADRKGAVPLVLNSRDVLMNPEKALSSLCDRVGLAFDKAMLNWPAGRRDSDGVWAPYWYKSVEASTGFSPYEAKEIRLTKDLQEIADRCQAPYEKMKGFAIEV
ncbi:HAD family hydrolase [Temperatibacter marinus]|uniref:HAD family hydrolase n=1 Tax=Temperatibacter marinus TaxID=1456591 RepID=A0AA52H9I9_9PROT|nr:HAD family hydrolase [Temperatibacter marinus]WND03246.1 HAD family hydrolase [Temperatibacter marinus]